MIIKRTGIILLISITVIIFSITSCSPSGNADIDKDEEGPPSTSEVQDIDDGVGDKKQLDRHSITLVGYQTFPAVEPIGDNTELLALEFFIENTSQGIVDYAISHPFWLILPDESFPWEVPSCESKVPVSRMYLEPGTSTTWYLCWVVPPASEAAVLTITYDYTAELVEGDEVEWEIRR